MPRSQWKPRALIFGQPNTNPHKNDQNSLIVRRSAVVESSYIGKTVNIHTGKSFLKVVVSESMLRRKFGEFALTRRLANHAKKTKKKKN